MEIIENGLLKATLNLKGGVLSSLIDLENNEELEYQIEEGSWPNQDVVIFPHPGDNKFKVEGKEYHIPTRHGILRGHDFKVLSKGKDFIELYVNSDKESKEVYPFDFVFILRYELKGKSLVYTAKVIALNEPILAGYGEHLAIKANEKGKVYLNKNTTLYPLVNGIIDLDNPIKIDEVLSLEKETFKKYDTLVIKNDTKSLIVDNGFNRLVAYKFDAPYFAIWSNPTKGNFVCIEPWWGISNYINEPKDLSKRKGIHKVDSSIEFTFSITF